MVVKLISTNKPGIPDLMLIKYGEVSFIEVKALGKKRTALQKKRGQELQSYGCSVRCVTENDVDVIETELEQHTDLGF
jgi:hypothetical protein